MSTHNEIKGVKTIQIFDEHINHEEVEILKKKEQPEGEKKEPDFQKKEIDIELDQYYYIRHKKRKMSFLI